MSAERLASALIIGDEVLAGKVEEKNARRLTTTLRTLGVRLARVCIVPDHVEEIAEELRRQADRYEFCFTSGGLGATHDDVTLQAVARAFGRRLVEEPTLTALLTARCGPLDEVLMRLTRVPEGTELLGAEALGFPILKLEHVYILPGVPEFFERQLDYLSPGLKGAPFVSAEVYISEPEVRIAEDLAALDAAHPKVGIGCYPCFSCPEYKTKITLESHSAAAVEAAKAQLLQLLDPGWLVER